MKIDLYLEALSREVCSFTLIGIKFTKIPQPETNKVLITLWFAGIGITILI